MASRAAAGALALLMFVEILVYLVSLPGFGIETRKFTDYAAWSGPIFLVLTVLVFLLGILGLLTVRRRTRAAAAFGTGQALAAIAVSALDLSAVAGPAAPPGPMWLGIGAILLGLLILGAASAAYRSGRGLKPWQGTAAPPTSQPPPMQP